MRRKHLLVTFIRHGQSVSNTAKRFGSQTDVQLSDMGRMQAKLTGEALAHAEVTRIFSSDLSRASDTAAAISAATGVKVEITKALRERDVGKLAGLTFEEGQSRYPDAYADLMSGDPKRRIGGGESYAIVADRVDSFLNPILKETEGHLVVVSHMVVLLHLLRRACGVDESTLRGTVTFAIENTSLHKLSYDRPPRDHWHVLGLNDAGHLRELKSAGASHQAE